MTLKTRIRLFMALAPAVLLVSLLVGPSDAVSPRKSLEWMAACIGIGRPADPVTALVMGEIRTPRVLLAFLVGGTLSTAGVSLQALFRNPLVSPYILGLQSGAAFGAALALGTGWLPVRAAAFGFGSLAVGLSYLLARREGGVSTVALILSGIVVTGIFTALLTIVQFFIDPFKLQTVVHWTMGNLHTASWEKLGASWHLMISGAAVLILLRWRMNVLALGDEHARAVGLNPERQKILILLAAALAASAAVSVAGVISMVGLVIPHMVRMMVGADNRATVPVCFAFGGAFLLIVDNISRTMAGFEIPIGIFTTLMGGPFFILLMKKNRIGWEA